MNLLPEYSLTRPDTVHCVDALTLMYAQPAQSVDAIITDLPYGTTACSWDTIIPFDALWAAVRHCLKPRGVFVTTASQPFTSALVMSNPKWFRYEWVWDKDVPTNFQMAAYQPLKSHENLVVFSAAPAVFTKHGQSIAYYPQMIKTAADRVRPKKDGATSQNVMRIRSGLHIHKTPEGISYPKSVIPISRYANECNPLNKLHPTQKPVALYEYLIRTYTQPGELVLDPCCGSGTTALAARNTGRHWICGDSDAGYVEIARQRFMTGTERLNRKASAYEDLPLFAQAEAVNA